jgi:signal peptidase
MLTMSSIATEAPIPVEVQSPGSNNHPDAAKRIRSAEQRTRPGVREQIKRALIWLAALLGAIAILVTIAPFFGWTVVRLATGSMAPTFPTDSLLVAHSVPASAVTVGDIVMVQRAGLLPITHRVVATAPAPLGATSLTLKGDDNRTADATAYVVRSVGLVEAGVPWGGAIFAALRSTAGMAALTVFATLVVLWAWWPSLSGPRRAASKHRVRPERA